MPPSPLLYRSPLFIQSQWFLWLCSSQLVLMKHTKANRHRPHTHTHASTHPHPYTHIHTHTHAFCFLNLVTNPCTLPSLSIACSILFGKFFHKEHCFEPDSCPTSATRASMAPHTTFLDDDSMYCIETMQNWGSSNFGDPFVHI